MTTKQRLVPFWSGLTGRGARLRSYSEERLRTYFQAEPSRLPVPFKTVLEQERSLIARRRLARGFGPPVADASEPVAFTGLALSGGGIRSATFCLGVLQSLHRHGLLRGVDYLSTVSGGGFAGGWLTAWLCRHPGTAFPPQESLAAQRPAAHGRQKPAVSAEIVDERSAAGVDALRHLRLYANYLTPRKGLLSIDSWRAATTIGRDLILTNAVLLPILLVVILVADVYFLVLDGTWVQSDQRVLENGQRFKLVMLPFGAIVGWFLALSLMWLRFVRKGRVFNTIAVALSIAIAVGLAVFGPGGVTPAGGVAGPAPSWEARLMVLDDWRRWLWSDWRGHFFLAWLTILLAQMYYALGGRSGMLENSKVRARLERCQTGLVIAAAAAAAILGLGAYGHEFGIFLRNTNRNATLAFIAENARWVTIATATLGSIYTVFKTSPSASADARSTGETSRLTDVVLAITPVAVLLVLALLSSYLAHWTIQRLWDESRQAGAVERLRLCTVGLLALCAYVVALESRFEAMRERKKVRLATRVGAVALIVLAALAVGRLAAPATLAVLGGAFAVLSLLALRAPLNDLGNTRPAWLLAAGFFSLAAMEAVRAPWVAPDSEMSVAIPLIGAVLAWIMAIGWFADPNALSLHAFYRERLVRGFLGASNPKRGERFKDIRDFDRDDDLPLSCAANPDLQGPYHVINATLNLTAGRDLASAQRSSDRFLLSPLYCGSSRTDYRPTAEYMDNALQLGTAMAVSGAAVSPVMGSVSPTAALSMLLTILNVRLGFWAPTPNKARWREETASLWPYYLLFEMTSQTNELASYCYLTDGGHFDNTGMYSLIERGCRNIILVDCGADSKPCFEDLGTAIRRCRIDFGTTIDIDLTPAMNATASERHTVLVGRITYDERHAKALQLKGCEGVLIVLKPAVGGQDSADVRQYALQNTAFPQHVTTDQWFDEAQFESYRRLGELTTDRALTSDNEVIAAIRAFATHSKASDVSKVFDHLGRASGLGKGVKVEEP